MVPEENHDEYQETTENTEAIFVSVFHSVISALLFRIFPSNVNIGVRPTTFFPICATSVFYQVWSVIKSWIKGMFRFIFTFSFIPDMG